MRTPSPEHHRPINLDFYDIGYVSGGGAADGSASITKMVGEGGVRFGGREGGNEGNGGGGGGVERRDGRGERYGIMARMGRHRI